MEEVWCLLEQLVDDMLCGIALLAQLLKVLVIIGLLCTLVEHLSDALRPKRKRKMIVSTCEFNVGNVPFRVGFFLNAHIAATATATRHTHTHTHTQGERHTLAHPT